MFSKINCDIYDISYYLLLLLLFSSTKDNVHRVMKFYGTDSGGICTGQTRLQVEFYLFDEQKQIDEQVVVMG